MSITKKFLWTLISIPLTLVAAVVAIISMGGGHGNSIAATYLFPYAMLTGLSTQMVNNTFVVIGLIQFPVYGLIADFTKGSTRVLIIVALAVIHSWTAVYVITNRG